MGVGLKSILNILHMAQAFFVSYINTRLSTKVQMLRFRARGTQQMFIQEQTCCIDIIAYM